MHLKVKILAFVPFYFNTLMIFALEFTGVFPMVIIMKLYIVYYKLYTINRQCKMIIIAYVSFSLQARTLHWRCISTLPHIYNTQLWTVMEPTLDAIGAGIRVNYLMLHMCLVFTCV